MFISKRSLLKNLQKLSEYYHEKTHKETLNEQNESLSEKERLESREEMLIAAGSYIILEKLIKEYK